MKKSAIQIADEVLLKISGDKEENKLSASVGKLLKTTKGERKIDLDKTEPTTTNMRPTALLGVRG